MEDTMSEITYHPLAMAAMGALRTKADELGLKLSNADVVTTLLMSAAAVLAVDNPMGAKPTDNDVQTAIKVTMEDPPVGIARHLIALLQVMRWIKDGGPEKALAELGLDAALSELSMN